MHADFLTSGIKNSLLVLITGDFLSQKTLGEVFLSLIKLQEIQIMKEITHIYDYSQLILVVWH